MYWSMFNYMVATWHWLWCRLQSQGADRVESGAVVSGHHTVTSHVTAGQDEG